MDMSTIVLIVVGLAFWGYSIYLINEEILSYQILDKNAEETPRSIGLNGPDWQVLRTMSQKRVWMIIAFVLAPLLVVAWGLTVIGALLFILVPQAIAETSQDVWGSIKNASRK